jgi:hypothetical protein
MNINDFFDLAINKTSSLEEALDYFKEMISDNQYIKELYKEWCLDMGYKLRNGFIEYYYEYISQNDSGIKDIFESNEEFYDYITYDM